jgi:hypothetical protein
MIMRNAHAPVHVHVSSSIGSVFGKALSAGLNVRPAEILEQILAFPPDERSALAVALIDSLARPGAGGISDERRAELRKHLSAL